MIPKDYARCMGVHGLPLYLAFYKDACLLQTIRCLCLYVPLREPHLLILLTAWTTMHMHKQSALLQPAHLDELQNARLSFSVNGTTCSRRQHAADGCPQASLSVITVVHHPVPT